MATDLPIHHLALRVAEPELSAAFYSGILGLPEVRRAHDESGRLRAVWLRAGGAVIMLERALRGVGAMEGSAHVLALAVADLATWETRLAAASVTVDDRTASTLYVRDPDGHRVGLSVFALGLGPS